MEASKNMWKNHRVHKPWNLSAVAVRASPAVSLCRRREVNGSGTAGECFLISMLYWPEGLFSFQVCVLLGVLSGQQITNRGLRQW